jgi:hypothetical protein
LEDDEFAIEERQSVLANVVAVSGVEGGEIEFGERGRRRQTIEQKLGVGVLSVSGSPVEWSRNWASIGDGVDKRTSNEFKRRVGGVDGNKEMNVDEMVDDAGAELEGAAGGERESVIGRVGVGRKSSNYRRGRRVTREEFGSREGTDIIGAKTGGERDAEGSRVSSGQMMDQWGRFDGGKVGVKDVERGIGGRWSGVSHARWR